MDLFLLKANINTCEGGTSLVNQDAVEGVWLPTYVGISRCP